MNVTMKDLARLAGVSRPAVSAVLNNSPGSRVSSATRERILRLAREMNFVPNQAARQLNGVSTPLVGLISVRSTLGLVAVLQAKVITLLQASGFEVLTSHLPSSPESVKRALDEFRARRVSGVVALHMSRPFSQPDGDSLPIVYCSTRNFQGFDVDVDKEAGGYLAARHLLEHGRRRIAYLGLDTGPSNTEKFVGVCRALRESGLDTTEAARVPPTVVNPEEMLAHVRRFHIDALICSNDHRAVATMAILRQAGLRVPEDVAVIGFDGYAFCDYAAVPLATVVQPIREQARIVVRTLIERIHAGEGHTAAANIRLQPTLRPSVSCGCAPQISIGLTRADKILLDDDDEV